VGRDCVGGMGKTEGTKAVVGTHQKRRPTNQPHEIIALRDSSRFLNGKRGAAARLRGIMREGRFLVSRFAEVVAKEDGI
jgi:hypothetical protein